GLRLSDSRAISSNGGRLEVDRCWFEGFDKAIELYAVDRTPTRISQTMFVPTGGQAPELSGWGVKIQSLRRKQPQPHLILEHCTFEGAGLLDLVDNERSTDPLQVVVKDCFVRATALMACKRDTRTPKQVQDQVTWQGTENRFEILGRDWIVLSANVEGTPAISTAVTDLKSWSEVAKETEPIKSELKYQVDSKERPKQRRPRDFSIATSGSSKITPGADPSQVGPWSNP